MSPNCRFFPSLWCRVWTLIALFQLNRHAKSNRHIRNVFEQRQAWPFYAAGPTWRDMITSCHLNCYHNVRTNVSGGGYFLWGNAHARCLSIFFFPRLFSANASLGFFDAFLTNLDLHARWCTFYMWFEISKNKTKNKLFTPPSFRLRQ